ncbi:MAG: UbiD family decarboxylase [bacterium]|jgi:UbiD family decarboxylase
MKDLRSALHLLANRSEHLLVTGEPVDPYLELAGVYRHAGAGTPVTPPARIGPAMLFENIQGYPGWRILAGMLASRERTAAVLGTDVASLPLRLLNALKNPIAPVPSDSAPCQEVIHREPLDLRKLVPVVTNTPLDAGPFITLGLLRAEDPETGASDVTIHRMRVLGPDTLTIFFVPGRHIDAFRMKAEAAGKALPVSINIGLHPAIYVASCFEPPTTPLGFDELSIAGALLDGVPVRLAPCVSVAAKAIADAEVVIEGEVLPHERVAEDAGAAEPGWAMPEFPGYLGRAQASVPVIRVRAITHRRQPIYQTLVGPGAEHTNLVGIPVEASILRLVETAMPGRLVNVYAHPSGGGKYIAILQFRKASPSDEGRQRQAALSAFAAFPELKHVILVDEDVDIFDTNDVLWAMTTRYQGDRSTVFIPGVRCHPLDPSQSPDFSPLLPAEGTSCKTIFDCTVPYHLRDRFLRPRFAEVNLSRFFPNGLGPAPRL